MKNKLSPLMLVTCLAAPLSMQAHAFGARAPAQPPVQAPVVNPADPSMPPIPPSQSSNVMLDFALDLAILYAKNEPRYAKILNTLGISNSRDLKGFLSGNANGNNFRNIAAHLIYQKASSDPKVNAVLTQLGITNLDQLKTFLSQQKGSSANKVLLDIALQYAVNNPKYATWLSRLNIKNVSDLERLLMGSGKGGNLQSLLVIVALNYVESNPKYSKYLPFIQLAMSTFGLTSGSDGSGNPRLADDDIIDLGPFAGMTVGETKLIQGVN